MLTSDRRLPTSGQYKHLLFVQFLDFVVTEAEQVAGDLMGVFAHERRDAADFARCQRHAHRDVFSYDIAGFRLSEIDEKTGGGVLLVVLKLIFDVLHHGGADIDALDQLHYIVGIMLPGPAGHPLVEFVFVAHALQVGGEIGAALEP